MDKKKLEQASMIKHRMSDIEQTFKLLSEGELYIMKYFANSFVIDDYYTKYVREVGQKYADKFCKRLKDEYESLQTEFKNL